MFFRRYFLSMLQLLFSFFSLIVDRSFCLLTYVLLVSAPLFPRACSSEGRHDKGLVGVDSAAETRVGRFVCVLF